MQTTPKRIGVAANESKGIERLQDRPQSYATFSDSAQPQLHRHHVDADKRRVKTLEELRDGAEFCELMDRASPGWQARGARR